MSFYFNLPFLLETCAHSACAKKGEISQPSNYRPISLTSVLSKVFESILNRKIWKHLNSSNLISDRQYPFVRNDLRVIFFPFSLTLGPPLFGISVNLLLSRWIYRKLFIESCTKL